MNCIMLFKEIITVYSETHKKSINTKYSVTDYDMWDILLPLGFKGLNRQVHYASIFKAKSLTVKLMNSHKSKTLFP
jgi:hypothetical protein